MSNAIVTGSSGLIGSEVVAYFCKLGWTVHGIDNNMRADFFGPGGDTRWNQHRLESIHKTFRHHELDIRDRTKVDEQISTLRPTLIVHTAAQPSHDLAASRPFDDFDVNAVGTLNLLEATRRHVLDAVFAYMSTSGGQDLTCIYASTPPERNIQAIERPSLFRQRAQHCGFVHEPSGVGSGSVCG